MSDLISRERIIDEISRDIDFARERIIPLTEIDAYKIAIRRATNLPAVDAEPVRHGKWAEGAIISGYQGIGKSTLAKGGSGYIDLESGNFFVDGVRHDDWYKAYAQIAIHLAEQGYRVFVSSHKVVREHLANMMRSVPLYVCFPSYTLEKPWIDKLRKRYERSELDKDFRAWKNAENRYAANIKELHETQGFIPIVINDMEYSLSRLLERYCPRCGAKMDGGAE